jgi:hypothetical protein
MARVPEAQQRFAPTLLVQTRSAGQHSQPISFWSNDPAGRVPAGQQRLPHCRPLLQSFFLRLMRRFASTSGLAACQPAAARTPKRGAKQRAAGAGDQTRQPIEL